jgi:hypothetical protein
MVRLSCRGRLQRPSTGAETDEAATVSFSRRFADTKSSITKNDKKPMVISPGSIVVAMLTSLDVPPPATEK